MKRHIEKALTVSALLGGGVSLMFYFLPLVELLSSGNIYVSDYSYVRMVDVVGAEESKRIASSLNFSIPTVFVGIIILYLVRLGPFSGPYYGQEIEFGLSKLNIKPLCILLFSIVILSIHAFGFVLITFANVMPFAEFYIVMLNGASVAFGCSILMQIFIPRIKKNIN